MINVELNLSEIAMALDTGLRRQLESVRRGLINRHGAAGSGILDGLAKHIEGVGGEMAFAKATDRFWGGSVNAGKAADVGDFQVRTRSLFQYDLLVRENDRSDEAFILVTGKLPCYQVVGWMYGSEAKDPKYKQNHGGHGTAYFVPQADLHPIGPSPVKVAA